MVLYLDKLDKLRKRLGFDGKDPVTMIDVCYYFISLIFTILFVLTLHSGSREGFSHAHFRAEMYDRTVDYHIRTIDEQWRRGVDTTGCTGRSKEGDNDRRR